MAFKSTSSAGTATPSSPMPATRSWSSNRGRDRDQRGDQMIQRRRRIVAQAGVDRRGLGDGAARRDQPVEALRLIEASDRAGVGVAGADARDDRERALDDVEVERGGREQRAEAQRIEVDARAQEV